jgi:hypothetical protein
MQVYHPTSNARAVIQELTTKIMKGEKGKMRAQELEEKNQEQASRLQLEANQRSMVPGMGQDDM